MKAEQATEVVELLIDPFPGPPWEANTVQAWARAIAATEADYRTARDVALHWAERNDRLPSLRGFLDVLAPRAVYVADPDAPLNPHPDVAQRIMGLWRKALADAKVHADYCAGRGHGMGRAGVACTPCLTEIRSTPPTEQRPQDVNP